MTNVQSGGMGASSVKKATRTPIGVALTSKPTNTHTDVRIDTITIHIFFDGTRNNRYNSEAHRDPAFKQYNRPKEISYQNYYSNIALLHDMMEAKSENNVYKFYLEGSGSTKYKKDDRMGSGLAWWSSGRAARHNHLINKLHALLKGRDYANVIFNIYGFSRGAAWARYFCYVIKKQGSKFQNSKINFVGILDTVSSDGTDHYNDTKDLGLDIGKPQGVNYVFHLTAQNDYRYHFPLTRIKGAIKDGIGFECSLPGAHSDIGGGYSEIYQEKDRKLTTDYHQDKEYIDYNWFIDMGYYTKQQLTEKPVSGRIAQEYGRFIQLYASRTTKFHYQFICFEILKAVAIQKANYKVNPQYATSNIDSMKNIDNYLKEVKSDEILKEFFDSCYSYIMENYNKKGGDYAVPLLTSSKMKYIYGIYIHNSLEYGHIANKGGSNNKENHDPKKPTRPMVTTGFR